MQRVLAVFFVLLVSLICSLPMAAQSALGTITGTITDPTGAPISNVDVTAKAVATNLTYKAQTNESGVYVIPNVPIGAFTVTASAPGFKQIQSTNLNVEVSQRLRVDLTLPVGNVSESVEVRAEIPRIQTEDSSLGTVVEQKRIEDLPLNGRHVFNLVKVVAGVVPRSNSTDGFAEVSNQTFSQMRINGGPAYGNQFFLDGVSNTAAVHNEVSVVPMADSVQEFRVETNGLKAEYGQTAGGVVNVVTKSGGNELHGSLYEFLRNDSLDSRNAFSTQPDSRTGRTKQVLRFNQFGGTAGGPVYIPKLYDGRNRTFFFAGWEQWKWRSTGAPQLGTVATAEQRNGDFSRTLDSAGRLIPIYDPATTLAAPGGGYTRTMFPGNIIPQNRIDALSKTVLGYMPLPNATPTDPFTNANNFVSLAKSTSDQTATTMRLDHRFSETDNLFFRYSFTWNTLLNAGYGLGVADPNARNDQRDNHNAVLAYTKTISSSVINEFRAGITRQWLPFLHPSFDQGWPAKLGFPSIVPQDVFPALVINGYLGISNSSFSGGLRAQNIGQIVDQVSIIRGKHSMKAGMDIRDWRNSFINRANPSGNFTFNSGLTGNPLSPAGTGNSLASLLLGQVQTAVFGYRPFFQSRAWPLGIYFQDDWKITPRLTINLGVRYDIVWGLKETQDRHSNFDPFIRNPQTNTLGVLTYAGVNGTPESYINQDRNNIGPRVGFAWDPTGDGKTSIRAAYGFVYLPIESGAIVPDNQNSLGFSVDTTLSAPSGLPAAAFQFAQGPSTLLQPLGPAGGPSAFRGQNVRYQDRNSPTGNVQQWNFALQRAIWGGWTVQGAYVGSKGTKLFGGNYDLNQLDPALYSLGLSLQDAVPNPYVGQISTGSLSGTTVARSQLLRPYPDYLTVTTWAAPNLSTTYHSLQLSAEKRFSSGLSLLASYTRAKLISGCSAIGGGNSGDACTTEFRIGRFNRDLDRGLDQDDIQNRFVISGVYELPVGKGKHFLSHAPVVVNGFLGGWQINGIGTFQGGMPLAVRGANNFTNINYPDVIRDPTLPSDRRSVGQWFDTDAFRNPANFTIGNAPRTLPNTRGPGLSDVSFSLLKSFRFLERFRLEVRGELFNALNHVNYNNPGITFSPSSTGTNNSAAFGRITSALDARRAQIGMRLTF